MKIKYKLLLALGFSALAALPCQAASVETPGFLKASIWWPSLRDPSATDSTWISTLLFDPNYPNTPDLVSYTAGFSTRGVFPDDYHEGHGLVLSGWLTPKVSGNYYFYTRSDDSSQFWISNDASEAGLQNVAEEMACCNPFQEPGNQQTSTAIPLVEGQKYAVQIFLKEGTGGDYVFVAMQQESGSMTPAASLQPLMSTMVSSMADTTGASLDITQQPVATSTPENAASVSFSVAATAVTPYGKYTGTASLYPSNGFPACIGTKAQLDTLYQWFTNGVEVPGANASAYTIAWPKKALNNTMVKCYVAVPGIPLYSSEVKLTVTDDTTKPTVVKANADVTFAAVFVKYSEPVTDSALTGSKYQIDQGILVNSVDRVDPMTVKLNTTKMTENKVYNLTINDVQDTATPANTIVANTKVQFQSFVWVAGAGVRQRYDGFNNDAGYNLNNLWNSPKYPNNPDRRNLTKRAEFPDDGGDNVEMPPWPSTEGREFYDTVEVWFTAPETTNYVFFTAFADHSWVFLSTDESPANKVQIISVDGWGQQRRWLTTDFGLDMNRVRTDMNGGGNQWATTPTITLQKGKKYYMQLVHHQPTWAGAQFYAVTYKYEGDADPPNGTVPRLEKSAIGIYLDPAMGGNVAFSLQPTNMTAYAGTQVTLYAAAAGTSPYGSTVMYQWQSSTDGVNFTDISGATGASYTPDFLVAGDNGKRFRARAMVPPAIAFSDVATLTVLVDEVAPTVVKTATDMSWNTVIITFSEPVTDATALNKLAYNFDQGVTVSSVTRIDPLTVKLTTSQLGEGKVYSMTVTGVKDAAGNTIAGGTIVNVYALKFMAGKTIHKKYGGYASGNPDLLFADPRFSDKPDRADILNSWEYPLNAVGRDLVADPTRDYMDTLESYFIPPTDGDYVFIEAGPDTYWLYLSTDDSAANKVQIAAMTAGWNAPRNWCVGADASVVVNARSDTFANTQWPGGSTIHLTGGQRYYLLQVHKDAGGQSWFGATFKLASDPDPANGTLSMLTGSVIGSYVDPYGNVNFTRQPQNIQVLEDTSASFTVAANGTSPYGTNVTYQWQSAPKGTATWIDIAGATAASYSTPFQKLADDGTQYRAVASVGAYSTPSGIAAVTILADQTAPVPTAGAMQDETPGVVDIGIGFNEPVDEASAKLVSNYSVSSGTITSLSYYTNRFTANSQNPLAKVLKQTVLLKVTGFSGSVTVKNVADTRNNKISATGVTIPVTVDTKMKWGVVGGHEFAAQSAEAWNAVVPVAANGWDIYSDGVGAWDRYDEATLVYEQVTGDFDKKVRVAYQDGSTTWARAGLIAKETLGFGDNRATQQTAAIRYQKCLIYPVGATLSGTPPGTMGSARWDTNRRLDLGGVTSGAPITGANPVPAFPNAWCRLKREGQKFTMYRSDDGVNWVLLGTTTWGVDDVAKLPMPATLYVGPDYAPEIGAVGLAEDRGTFLGQFRDYGNYSAEFSPQLQVGRNAEGKVVITWTTGTLVSSPTVEGTYGAVPSATSPWVVTPGTTTFYKVRQ